MTKQDLLVIMICLLMQLLLFFYYSIYHSIFNFLLSDWLNYDIKMGIAIYTTIYIYPIVIILFIMTESLLFNNNEEIQHD